MAAGTPAGIGYSGPGALAAQGVCSPENAQLERLNPEQKQHLRQLPDQCFNVGELKRFCDGLDVDYEHLSKDNKVEKIANLSGHLERRKRTRDLVKLGRKKRPRAAWDVALPTVRQSLTRAYKAELRELEKRGFTQKDESIPIGWRAWPLAFLWWLVDEFGWLSSGSDELIHSACTA